MTPIFCCGGECGILGTLAHWSTSLGSPSISTTTKRSGDRSIRCNAAASTCAVTTNSNLTIGGTLGIIRFYIFFTTLPGTSDALMWFTTAGGSTGGLWFKSSDSSLYASVGSVTGSTGFAVVTGRWYRVDLKLNVIADPWLCDVMIDGNALGQASSSTTASTISLVRLGFSTSDTFDIFYDDIVISKTTADYPIGAGYIHHFVPTSDGTHNIAGTGDFQRGNTGVDILNATTTAYQLIDDIPLPSGAVAEADCWRGVAPANPASDYVEVKFGPAPGIPTPTVAPRAVEFILAHHQISTTVGQMAVNVFDGGSLSTVFDTGSAAGVTTYRYARKNYITGGTWHIGGADSGDFGNLRTRFVGIDCNPDQCLDAIMIEAEFDEFRHRQEDIQQPYFGKTLIAPSGQKNNSRVT